MTVTVAIVGLLGLIFIHELGHFVVAKLVGLKATRFYIGFPPAVLRRTVGETEYGIGAIPLGGFVRIVGMNRPQGDDLYRVVDAVDEATVRRDASELGDAVGSLRKQIDAGLPDAALRNLPRVRELLDEVGPALDETTHAQAVKDLTRLEEDLDPRAYWRAATWRRIATIIAGPLANVIFAIVILFVFFFNGVPVAEPTRVVESVTAADPAGAAGLRAGDEIAAVNGVAVVDAAAITKAIQASKGGPVTLTVVRDGERTTLKPQSPVFRGQRYLLGFMLESTKSTESLPAGEAAARSVRVSWAVTTATVGAVGDLFRARGTENLTTPVGIVAESSRAVEDGSYLGVLAFISLSLAIFNMLPFLPLDGGHIVVALVERARGRPVPRRTIERVSVAGILLVVLVFLIAVTNDVGRYG